uniref:Candidate secreted effector n=1 Tax=Meloidogyne incognita TaxID=6306 RepID=A0A914NQ05_MELIC
MQQIVPDSLLAFGLLLSLVQRKHTIFFRTFGVLLPSLFRILSRLVLHPEPDQNCNDDPDKEASSNSNA